MPVLTGRSAGEKRRKLNTQSFLLVGNESYYACFLAINQKRVTAIIFYKTKFCNFSENSRIQMVVNILSRLRKGHFAFISNLIIIFCLRFPSRKTHHMRLLNFFPNKY